MRSQRLMLAVLVPVLGLLLPACGKGANAPGVATANGGSGRTGASASPSPVDREEAKRKYSQCMRDHGINMPDPQPGDKTIIGDLNVDKKTFNDALKACEALVPDGGTLSKLSPEQFEQVRKFAQCMRDHGVNVADPDPNGNVAKIITDDSIDVNGQAFKDAAEACKNLRPSVGAGGKK